jgi:hypothetical protein
MVLHNYPYIHAATDKFVFLACYCNGWSMIDYGAETQRPVKFSCGFVNANGKRLWDVETQQPVKFSCSFVNANGKRLRDEEMITSLSCKKAR